MPHVYVGSDSEASRTSRFAKFLRGAVAIKTRRVTDVGKYPTVMWFCALPSGIHEVRSPLFTPNWPADDIRWLTVARVPEPPRPAPPDVCKPWLNEADLDTPGAAPQLNSYYDDKNEYESTEVPPTQEAEAAWTVYVTQQWTPWAAKASVARAVRPVYQKLFAVYQEMQGRSDAYDLFVGVGLLDSRSAPPERVRRHLLAFRAELNLEDKSGTISLWPSADFVSPTLETDFLCASDRARLQVQGEALREDLTALGPALHDRRAVGDVLMRLVTPLNAVSQYEDSLPPIDAPVDGCRVSYAPALILRLRSTRSLDALLERIESDAAMPDPAVPLQNTPLPWRKMMEDDRAWGSGASGGQVTQPTDQRLYFPLPSNAEQSRIVKLANGSAGVVVQGPPGTGKSHTIANLISHYLATGQRVLVTAQTAQALEVLRDKMPQDLQQLCVSLLGDSRASDKYLRRSVEGILGRRQGFDEGRQRREVAALEAKLTESETRLNHLERTLHQARVAETQELEPLPGYRGTRSQIARRLREERSCFAWITDAIPHETECPSYAYGWNRLADYHAALDANMRAKLARACVGLPFTHAEAITAIGAIATAKAAIPDPATHAVDMPLPAIVDRGALAAAEKWLAALQEVETEVGPEDDGWVRELRPELLRSALVTWRARQAEFGETLDRLTEETVKHVVEVRVVTRSAAEARRDLTRLAEYYSQGGKRRVLGLFKPAIVKQVEWVEDAVTVEGLPVHSPEEVGRARRALDGLAALDASWGVWAPWPADRKGSPRSQLSALRHRARLLERLLAVASGEPPIPAELRNWLSGCLTTGIVTDGMLMAIRRRLAELHLADARATRDALAAALRQIIRNRDVVPALTALLDALTAEDAEGVSAALAALADEQALRELNQRYQDFIGQVRRAAPKLADALVDGEGTPAFSVAFKDFENAWQHHRAESWLDLVLSKEKIEATHLAVRDERQRGLQVLGQLAAAKAWGTALERIDDRRRASLTSWAQAVAGIPATGLKVFRRRAEAQRLLGGCLDAIPAWVVSLGRLYETVEARPGLFDIAIVDEASQCWLDSLVLFYLAKQVIIVGDDRQISPTIVGVADEEVEALARTFLPDFEYGFRFTLGSSLFDHARRYLSAGVPLREHFRCVPEIIGFSNDLCYSGSPLIPLRQVGKNRLEPLKRTYLPEGLRMGDINDAEAEAIVDAIAHCHEDPAYQDCEFGVICLQGDMQGARIDQLLIERLGPNVYTKRRLRCGNPHVFQGDERDVMFISMVAAPNARQQSLTTSMYEQRFNVAMSRARDQMWLFHSIQQDELGGNCLRRQVLDFFSTPPNLKIHGSTVDIPTLQHAAEYSARQVQRPPEPFDSWFEVDVALALAARGYTLSAQVEVAHKAIDLVIEGNEGLRLAIECDGEIWHGPEHYEADVARQRQLERAGWTFVRVRESLFYSDEARAIAEVVAACEELDIEPGDGRAPTTAPADAPGLRADVRATPVAGDLGSDWRQEEAVTLVVESEDSEAARTEDQEPEVPEEPLEQEPLVHSVRSLPFTGYGGKGYPDPRTAPLANVRDAVLDIVTADGPLPKKSIYQLYREGCPRVERASKHLKQAVNRALYSLERTGQVVSSDEGTRRLPTDVIVALPTQGAVGPRPVGARKLDDVPLAEIAVLMKSVQGPNAPGSEYERVNLYREVGRRFGVRRLQVAAVQRLRRAERLAYPTAAPPEGQLL